MTIPACAVELVKEFEGFRAKAYPDPIRGWRVPTIGYGTTRYSNGMPVKRGHKITEQQAEYELRWHMDEVCTPQLSCIPTWARMNDNQRGALYSFAYNLGAAFYGSPKFKSISQVCDLPERWDVDEWVREQFVKYRNPGTSAEPGLKRRREAEAALFCTPMRVGGE